jgi:hypothetical protein
MYGDVLSLPILLLVHMLSTGASKDQSELYDVVEQKLAVALNNI